VTGPGRTAWLSAELGKFELPMRLKVVQTISERRKEEGVMMRIYMVTALVGGDF
jgi:hypothetical protein